MTVIRSRKPVPPSDEVQAEKLREFIVRVSLHSIATVYDLTFGFLAGIMGSIVTAPVQIFDIEDFVIMPDGSAVAVKFKGSRNFYYLPLQ